MKDNIYVFCPKNVFPPIAGVNNIVCHNVQNKSVLQLR